MKQIILYIIVIALLLFVLIMTGSAVAFVLTGATAPRPTLSFITVTPDPKLTAPSGSEGNGHELISTPSEQNIPHEITAIPLEPIKTSESSESIEKTSEPEPVATPYCGLPSPATILLINAGESNFIRIVQLDPTALKTRVYSVPCNLWVSTPSLINDYTISATRICSILSMFHTEESMDNNIFAALNATLNDNFKIKADHYLMTSDESINLLMNKLDETDNEALNPNQGDSEWQMLEQQDRLLNAVLTGFQAKNIPLSTILDSSKIKTNYNAADLSGLECTIRQIPPQKVEYINLFQSNTTKDEDGTLRISDINPIIEGFTIKK